MTITNLKTQLAMNKNYLASTLLLLTQLTFGQLATTNERVIGGTMEEVMSNRLESPSTTDYFLTGSSYSDISGDKSQNSKGRNDLWIVRMDEDHHKVWDKTIGGNQYEFVIWSLLYNDKIYSLSTSFSGISGDKTSALLGEADMWLVCLDLDGNILWQQSYGGAWREDASKLYLLNNGNILICGTSNSYPSGNKTENTKGVEDYWLIEINPANGEIINQKTIGSPVKDVCNDIWQDTDGMIYVLGSSANGFGADKSEVGYGMQDLWLVKLDEDLNILQEKCFGGNADEVSYGAVLRIKDDYIYMLSNSSSGVSGNKTAANQGGSGAGLSNDYWVVKTDLNLNVSWDRTFGGSAEDNSYTILEYDDNLILCGSSFSTNDGNKTSLSYGETDSWFVKMDTDGNMLNQITIGGDQDDYSELYFSVTNPGKLYYAGSSISAASGMKTLPRIGNYDYWIMELQIDEFLALQTIDNEGQFLVSPNPFAGQVKFSFPENKENLKLTITTVDGKVVQETLISAEQKEILIHLNQHDAILLYTIEGTKTRYSGKLIAR